MPHSGHRHHSHGGRQLHPQVMSGVVATAYDRLASRWLLKPLYRWVAETLAAAVPAGGLVLDVGTGPGRLLVELSRRRPDLRITGVDPSQDMVDLAQRHLDRAGRVEQVQVRLAGAEELPFPNAHFDAVVSTLSGHHWADPVAAVAEQRRVLRPGGSLWLVDSRRHEAVAVTDAVTAAFPAGVRSVNSGGPLLRALIHTRTAVR